MHSDSPRSTRDECTCDRRRVLDADVERDIARVCTIWRIPRTSRRGGPWLFGAFSIADCMYAVHALHPMALRAARGQAYVATMLTRAALQSWISAAAAGRICRIERGREIDVIGGREAEARAPRSCQDSDSDACPV
jgi:hypothetical protein